MLHKLKQQTKYWKLTPSNRLPHLRSRQFLLNILRLTRVDKSSGSIRAAMGMVRWSLFTMHTKKRIGYRNACLITGRARGVSQRFGIARTKVKHLADQGKLFGVRKSSW
jgi:ribosomal protein S14